jgi:hypothetical protein
MRKILLAGAAALTLGTATMTTGAMAAPPHGHGAFHGGPAFHGGWHGGWGGLYAFGGPAYYGGCWQRRWVPTPFGPRWRLVNVCY